MFSFLKEDEKYEGGEKPGGALAKTPTWVQQSSEHFLQRVVGCCQISTEGATNCRT
jgi:hypothetical protein